MIQSILDTDVYKFSTSYAYMKLFPDAEGTFEFCDRNNTEYNKEFIDMLKLEFASLSLLSLKSSELEWCKKNIRFIPQHYWEWLSSFKFDFNKIDFGLDSNNHLHIKVTDKLYKVTLYEVPILAIVSEATNKWKGNWVKLTDIVNKLLEKIEYSKAFVKAILEPLKKIYK
jgi:nicotinate phosphoribosyltransferase